MIFFKHFIGDYDADTTHLTWDEDMAYTRLMRAYYRRELPIPADLVEACRITRAHSPAQKRAVETVLKEFFVLEDTGWRNKRCDEEIEASKEKGNANRENGKKGGRPRKNKNPDRTHEKPSGFSDNGEDQESEKPSGLLLGSDLITQNNLSHSHSKPTTSSLRSEVAAEASPEPKVDLKTTIFTLGVQVLRGAGSPEAAARSFLGKYAKQDENKLAEVIGYLAANPKIEPKAYIAAAMAPKKPELCL